MFPLISQVAVVVHDPAGLTLLTQADVALWALSFVQASRGGTDAARPRADRRGGPRSGRHARNRGDLLLHLAGDVTGGQPSRSPAGTRPTSPTRRPCRRG